MYVFLVDLFYTSRQEMHEVNRCWCVDSVHATYAHTQEPSVEDHDFDKVISCH